MRVAYPDSSMPGSSSDSSPAAGANPGRRDCIVFEGLVEVGDQEWKARGGAGGLNVLWVVENERRVLGLTVAGWMTDPEVTLYTPIVGDDSGSWRTWDPRTAPRKLSSGCSTARSFIRPWRKL